jgi:ribosome-associated protein
LTPKIAQKKQNKELEALRDRIVEAAQDKKAQNVTSLDLRKITDAVCDFFIVCDAQSGIQVKAIADHIVDQIRKETGESPLHTEGLNNLEWVLIDYVDVVVHVFKTEMRDYYQLEELWLDAERKDFE